MHEMVVNRWYYISIECIYGKEGMIVLICVIFSKRERRLTLYGNVVPPVNYHFLHLTPVQTETSFGVSLFVKHRLLSRSGQGLSASLLFKTCR